MYIIGMVSYNYQLAC